MEADAKRHISNAAIGGHSRTVTSPRENLIQIMGFHLLCSLPADFNNQLGVLPKSDITIMKAIIPCDITIVKLIILPVWSFYPGTRFASHRVKCAAYFFN
jgi:hypothetical protein